MNTMYGMLQRGCGLEECARLQRDHARRAVSHLGGGQRRGVRVLGEHHVTVAARSIRNRLGQHGVLLRADALR